MATGEPRVFATVTTRLRKYEITNR